MCHGIFEMSDSGRLNLLEVIKGTKKEAESKVKELKEWDNYEIYYIILKVY